MKKAIFGALGLLIIVGTIGNLKYITDWSNGELIGYNIWTLVAFSLGGYFVYYSLKKTPGLVVPKPTIESSSSSSFCHNCGSKLKECSNFCSNCGKGIK